MKNIYFSIITCILSSAFTVPAFAQEGPPPSLKYVMSYRADLASPQVVSKNRLIFNVTGGWLETEEGAKGLIDSKINQRTAELTEQ